jgi:hypothetical protein
LTISLFEHRDSLSWKLSCLVYMWNVSRDYMVCVKTIKKWRASKMEFIWKGKYIIDISEIRWKLWICMCMICDFMDCYTFLEGSHFLFFLRVERCSGGVGVAYASCMTVSDLMWRLLLNAHSLFKIINCVYLVKHMWILNPRFNLSIIKYSRTVTDHYYRYFFSR